MAGGQKINDHSNWIGSSSKESPLPMNSKMKQYMSAGSAGAENDYEDTSEMIKKQQDMGMSKAKAHPLKSTFRN